jgi:hypothetical protein
MAFSNSFFRTFFLSIFFSLVCCFFASAQQVRKGLPADLEKTELVILRYEPKDLIPSDAKSHVDIYIQDNDLQKTCAEANAQLIEALKYTFPFSYRVISRNQLNQLKGKSFYVFDPAEIYGTGGPWGTVPLYLRHSVTGEIYEIGFMPKNGIFSAEKVIASFLQSLPKTIPVQALEDNTEVK